MQEVRLEGRLIVLNASYYSQLHKSVSTGKDHRRSFVLTNICAFMRNQVTEANRKPEKLPCVLAKVGAYIVYAIKGIRRRSGSPQIEHD